LGISGGYFLANAASYNLEYAILIIKNNRTRLVVIGDRKLLKEKEFKSVKAAKISFTRNFNKRKKSKEFVKPDWLKASFEHLRD